MSFWWRRKDEHGRSHYYSIDVLGLFWLVIAMTLIAFALLLPLVRTAWQSLR
jgi:hypothetical protein